MFRDARRMGSSTAIAALLTGVRSLLVMRLLGPEIVGPWKAMMLFYLAIPILMAGVLRGLALRIPVLDGQGDRAEGDRYALAAGHFARLSGLVLCLTMLSASFAASPGPARTAMRLFAVVALIAPWHMMLRETSTARRLFTLRSREVLLAAGVDFAVTLALAWRFGLVGLGLGTAISVLIPALFLWTREGRAWSWRFDAPRLREMARIGLPSFLADSLMINGRMLDAVVISAALGPTQVGYYALSLLVLDFSVLFTSSGVTQVVTPHLMREFGRAGSAASAVRFYEAPVKLLCYMLPPVLALGSLLIPGFVHMFLPRYAAGIEAAQMTLWCVFFMAIQGCVDSFHVASGRMQFVLKTFAGVSGACLAAQFAAAWTGWGLTGVAGARLAATGLIALIGLYVARRSSGDEPGRAAAWIAGLMLPLAASVALAAALPSLSFGSMTDAASVAARAAVLAICYAPILAIYENRFAMLRTLRQAV